MFSRVVLIARATWPYIYTCNRLFLVCQRWDGKSTLKKLFSNWQEYKEENSWWSYPVLRDIAEGTYPLTWEKIPRVLWDQRMTKWKFLVIIAEGTYPIPFRTRKSSPLAPMVLHGRLCGRVGRCQDLNSKALRIIPQGLFCLMWFEIDWKNIITNSLTFWSKSTAKKYGRWVWTPVFRVQIAMRMAKKDVYSVVMTAFLSWDRPL